ncbi:hypothetical protein A1O3_09094 [Capronia epimyces CBS 606.96]|uniref:Zn(2)-C6 fungal-type domain-containing protein n=1 Tax=Capronia epimyces CBS 606.96 TaxID=1182542 RepID=W9XKU6_9EURO|nr:uncharacterized protein A1O3_09094 [Capronia epimyces CBS 606.96]EXJ77935.1 hypothetical protein A1O3_09094 [Capronia epimyces CBS 606.96]
MVGSDESRARVRQKYTAHACLECQRRKRKCSGETVCKNCRYTNSDCVYSPAPSRFSKPRRLTQLSPPDSTGGHWSAVDVDLQPYAELSISSPVRPMADDHADANRELTLRTQALEQKYEMLRRELAALKGPEHSRAGVHEVPSRSSAGELQRGRGSLPPTRTRAQARPRPRPSAPTDPGTSTTQEAARENVFERNTTFVGGTSFFHQIDLLDRSVARDHGSHGGDFGTTSPSCSGGRGQAVDLESSVATMRPDIDQIVAQTRQADLDAMRQCVDMYFTNVHPFLPCINEAHFRSQLAGFLAAADETGMPGMAMGHRVALQFATLLNFIMAVAHILHDTHPGTPGSQDDYVPGWKEFCRAEKLLVHTTWLEMANMVTIQILLVKASYYVYVSKLNAAYDTMGTAVRLCFQQGLHNEPAWGEACNLTFYDRTYRQRVFWCIYCLNHNVAQNAGAPDLICDLDFDVDLPRCVDDRMLYPNCPPLPEIPKASPIPLLLEIVRWAKLSSEIWDAMFGVRAQKPISPEFVAATDDKIMQLSTGAPRFLSWPPADEQGHEQLPAFITQQSFILYLRIRHLRMLLRREEMVSLRYEKKTARLCIEIATEVVNAVELYYSSKEPRRADRYAYTLHLTGAIVPMICIIVRRDNADDVVRPAIHLFHRSLKIMQAISHGLAFARRTLDQLGRPIHVARNMIDSKWPQYARPPLVNSYTGPSRAPLSLALPPGMTPNPHQTWTNDANGPGGNVNAGGDPLTNEQHHRAVEDVLTWEDLDLWSNMNNW